MSDKTGGNPSEILYRAIREQDARDFHAELAGLDNGRIKRFLSPEAQLFANGKQDEKASNGLTMLDILLLTDPTYAKLYADTMDLIDTMEHKTLSVLSMIGQRLEQAHEQMQAMDQKANTLPDGTKIYRNAKGEVFTEDGVKLSAEQTKDITWNDSHPSWEEYSALKDKIARLQKHKQEMETYRDQTLNPIKERMQDHTNPPDKDEMKGFMDELEKGFPKHTASLYSRADHNTEASPLMSDFHESMEGGADTDNAPDLQAGFEAARLDIPDLGAVPGPKLPSQ